MKISVVIPLYNVEPWIEKCLLSVLGQSHPEMECIVVDDCCTDNSGRIVERIREEHPDGDKVVIIHHSRNRGVSVSRNSGTDICRGDYIFYLDGDDELEPGALETLANAAEETDYPDWVQGNYSRIDETSGKIKKVSYYYPDQYFYPGHESVVRHFARLNFSNATNKLIRRDFILRYGLAFRDRLIYEDTLWCMQAYQHVETITTVPMTTYRHNLRPGSVTYSTVTTRKVESLLLIVRKLCQMPRDVNVEKMAVRTALYGIRNLYMGAFPVRFRRRWFRRLWETGVTRIKTDTSEIRGIDRSLMPALRINRRLARLYSAFVLFFYRMSHRSDKPERAMFRREKR